MKLDIDNRVLKRRALLRCTIESIESGAESLTTGVERRGSGFRLGCGRRENARDGQRDRGDGIERALGNDVRRQREECNREERDTQCGANTDA